MIADPHFGKAASFRAAGVPVPAGTTRANLSRLTLLIETAAASRLIVLGDFFHAAHGRSDQLLELIASWRRTHPALEIINVRGNHDRCAGDPPGEWGIACHDEPFSDAPFRFIHDPEGPACRGLPRPRAQTDLQPAFAGHLHPCARLIDVDGSTLRSPCFWFRPRVAVLPAFGSFTGTHLIDPRPGDRIFTLGESEVVEVSTQACC